MSDCRFGVSPVNYPDPDPETIESVLPGKSKNLFVSIFSSSKGWSNPFNILKF